MWVFYELFKTAVFSTAVVFALIVIVGSLDVQL